MVGNILDEVEGLDIYFSPMMKTIWLKMFEKT